MTAAIGPIAALLTGLGILLLGNGLQNILLPIRGALEGMSTATIGLVMAAYYVGFVVGCLRAAYLVRRVGHIRAFAVLAAIAAAAALAYALVVDAAVWAVLRAVSGFAFAGLAMVAESWLNEKATNQNRGAILSVYRIVDLAASTGGQLLLNLDSPQDFSLFSVVAILICLALVPVALTTAAGPRPIQDVRLRLGRLYRNSPLGVVGCLAVGLANGAVWSLAPVYAGAVGLSPAGITYFMSAFILGGALIQWPIGRLSDRYDRRVVLTATCFAAALLGAVLALAGAADPAVLLAIAVVFGGAALPLYPLSIAYVNDRIAPTEFLEAAGALLLVFGLGAVAGPIVAGLLMSGFEAPALFLYTAAVHAGAGLFALWRMRQRAPVPLAEQEVFVAVPRTSPAVFELDPRGGAEGDAAGRTDAAA